MGLSEVQFVFVGVVVLFYSVSGGSWAVMATDVIQSLVLIPLTVLVASVCMREIGWIGGFSQAVDDAGPRPHQRVVAPAVQRLDSWALPLVRAWCSTLSAWLKHPSPHTSVIPGGCEPCSRAASIVTPNFAGSAIEASPLGRV